MNQKRVCVICIYVGFSICLIAFSNQMLVSCIYPKKVISVYIPEDPSLLKQSRSYAVEMHDYVK